MVQVMYAFPKLTEKLVVPHVPHGLMRFRPDVAGPDPPWPVRGSFQREKRCKMVQVFDTRKVSAFGVLKTSEIGPACRREHDFRVSPASRKKLDLGVILGVIL